MSVFSQVFQMFTAFFGSLKFVVKYKLYLYFLPAIILAILFYMSMRGGSSLSNKLNFMSDWWLVGKMVDGISNGIKSLSFLFFEIVILVFLMPINSYFAEKVKEDLTGEKVDFGFGQFIGSIFRSIRIFAMAFGAEISLIILVWFFSFLVGDWFYEVVSFVITAYFIGFSFFDFGLELNGQKSRASWQWARKNKTLSLVAGLIFSLTIYIPEQTGLLVLFLVTISLVPHMLTIAATQVYFKGVADKNVA